MFLLTAFTVVATIVLGYILVSLIKAGEAKLAKGFRFHANNNDILLDRDAIVNIRNAL